MSIPNTTHIHQTNTHRLIPSEYGEDSRDVYDRIAEGDDGHLRAIMELDGATNERLRTEKNHLSGQSIKGPAFDIPYQRIINTAFSHAHPEGSRFNGPDRGAWYAGFDIETAQAEIAWHKTARLATIATISRFVESIVYDDYLSDFDGEFHDMRGDADCIKYLDPKDYAESQRLAETLVKAQSSGIVYPSVRRKAGVCLVCFRPAMVGNVRKGLRYRFTWSGSKKPEITPEPA